MTRFLRRSNRLKGYDYSQAGYYFITVCAKEKRRLFWEFSTNFDRDIPPSVAAACGRHPLSAIGLYVQSEIEHLSHIYDGISVDKYVIMPNHIHMILCIQSPEEWRPQAAATVGHIINQFKGSVSKKVGHSIWQKSYHDHIIRNNADYLRIWQYIDTNPAKWREDCYYTECTEETP